MTTSTPPAARIELRLRDLNQMFNSIDPSPFRDRDLDDEAEDFIVGWARELPADHPLEVVIHLDALPETEPTAETCARDVKEAVQHFFLHKAEHERREFSELMRIGRISLVIGLAFLIACFLISRLFADDNPATFIIRESLVIVGWVAMWRPLEVFLYDWWPIRRHVRLYRRLARAEVTVRVAASDA